MTLRLQFDCRDGKFCSRVHEGKMEIDATFKRVAQAKGSGHRQFE